MSYLQARTSSKPDKLESTAQIRLPDNTQACVGVAGTKTVKQEVWARVSILRQGTAAARAYHKREYLDFIEVGGLKVVKTCSKHY